MSKYSKTIHAIRKFNRFYMVNMEFLNSNYMDSNYSIIQTRILFEIKNGACTQKDIVNLLHIDKSYLSRIVQRLWAKGIIQKTKSDADKRTTRIALTETGKLETDRLIQLTNEKIETKVVGLSSDECNKLCNAFNTIISILGREGN